MWQVLSHIKCFCFILLSKCLGNFLTPAMIKFTTLCNYLLCLRCREKERERERERERRDRNEEARGVGMREIERGGRWCVIVCVDFLKHLKFSRAPVMINLFDLYRHVSCGLPPSDLEPP